MYKEDVLLTVNEEFKVKLWQFMKDNFKCNYLIRNYSIHYFIITIMFLVCKRTCLGPVYGGAINKLLILNQNDAQNDY